MEKQPLEIRKGVARPENLPPANQGGNKYNFAGMEVDDYVEVPKEWYKEPFVMSEYDGTKHRNRVYQAARTHADNHAKAERVKEGFDASQFTKKKFTAVHLENGNIGVWRDA